MKKLAWIILLVFSFLSSDAFAQMPGKMGVKTLPLLPETKELVQRLLEANGMRENLIRIFEDIINQAPVEKQKELRDILKTDEIIEVIIPVYAKNFTADELKELITFYKSPAGAKNLKLTPVLMNQVMQASGKYFEDRVNQLEKSAPAKAKP